MRLRLSNTPQVLVDGLGARPLATLDAALLAWLALEGPTPRARLAALLWPDRDGEAARNSLRQRLFQLRRQLGGAEIVVGQGTLALAPGIEHDLDAADGVLDGAELPLAGDLALWLAQQRGRRRERMRQSLVELSEMAEAARDWGDALAHANELLALDPLSEDAHRRVMRLHYLAGDRAAALLAFDRCEQLLKDEVGIRPSADTLALLATLEAAARPSALPVAAAVPASVLRPPRMVGRDRELAALQAASQAGQVAALIGEAGLGKTRLLQEFADRRPGVVHVAGRPGDAGVPFATLARLLRAVVALGGEAAQPALPAPTRSEIARVLPEFDALGAYPAGEGRRLVLLRAVRALLAAHPQLAAALVDDLHFADDASLEMIGHLIDGSEDSAAVSPLRWVLAYRPAEAGSPVQALHDRLVEQVRLVPVALAPLDEAALAELVDSLALPGVLGTALAPGLLQRTGGNPLFVLETLKQAWVERTLGALADARSLPRPPSVGRLIERRIAQLSTGALTLARVASIAGVDFGIALAEHVLQASAMQFADAMNELEAAQVLRGTQFAHDLVFDAVRSSVPPAIAQHTHARVAAWLEAHGGDPARIARHWIDGGAGARALPWLERAADAAAAAVRRKEQIGFLEEKSALEAAAGATDAAFATMMAAAEVQVTLDGAGTQGLAQCDRLDALARTTEQRVQARLQRSHRDAMRGELVAAQALAAEALRDALRAGVAPALVIECRHHLATALSLQSRIAEALPQFEAMISWIDEHGDDARRCEFHGNLAMTYDQCGRLADALPHHEAAVAAAQRLGHHGNTTMCLSNHAAGRILAGDLDAGEALLGRARALRTLDADAASIDAFIALNQAICDTQRGRYGRALATLQTARDLLAAYAPGYVSAAAMHEATCWAHLGQWARLHRTLEALGDPQALPHSSQARRTLLRHWQARAAGQRPDEGALEQAIAMAADSGLPDLGHALRIELAAGRPPRDALALLDGVIDEAASMGHEGTVLAARARAAAAAAPAGDLGLAREQVHAALALARRVGTVRHYALDPLLHCARALQALGDDRLAAATLHQACEWITATAADHVPAEFRNGFLNGNAVNRELQALAAQLPPA